MADPIARGRDADVFAVSDGRVLRRYRRPQPTLHEAAIMQHVRAHGFPAPEVFEARGPDLVLRRLRGPTLLADLTRRPWRLVTHARTLAALHRRLEDVPAPAWLAPAGTDGPAVCHLDLHPDNVILTPDGPVVIDWTNARRGPAGLDLASTWLLLSVAAPPGGRAQALLVEAMRRAFVRALLAGEDRGRLRPLLPVVAERRLADPNMRDDERERIRRFVAREARAT